MKKIVKIIMLVICLLPINSFAADPTVNVIINGKPLVTDTPAMVKDQRTLVPFRALFEALGATDITWDEPTQTVTGRTSDTFIKLVLGSYDMEVNGKTVTMDVAPVAVNFRTMIPLSMVSSSMGADVKWDQDNFAAIITTKGQTPAQIPVQNNNPPQTISPVDTQIEFKGQTIGNDIRGYFAMEDLARNKYVIYFMDKGKAEMINVSNKSKTSGTYSYSKDKLKLSMGSFNSSYKREDEKYNGSDIILMRDEKNLTSGSTFAMTGIDKSEYEKYLKKDDKDTNKKD